MVEPASQQCIINDLQDDARWHEERLDRVRDTQLFKLMRLYLHSAVERAFYEEAKYVQCQRLYKKAQTQNDPIYLDTVSCVIDEAMRRHDLDPRRVLGINVCS